ncbi:MAG: thioredoxin [Coriobacteriia bacterium]|nr:thioredoxin [Coriobacteriia bacterium]
MSEMVTSADFASKVLEASKSKPVLVDFFATWCGPCRAMAPALEEVAAENADAVDVYKLDIDQSPDMAREYRVFSVPTLILFKDGAPARQVVGAQPKDRLEAFIR